MHTCQSTGTTSNYKYMICFCLIGQYAKLNNTLLHFTLSVTVGIRFPNVLYLTHMVKEHTPLHVHKANIHIYMDHSHCTGISEIVQQLKVFPHHSEAYLLTIFFINTLFCPIFSFLCCLQCSLQHF